MLKLGYITKRLNKLEAQRETAVDFLLFSLNVLYRIELRESKHDTGLDFEECKFNRHAAELTKITINQFKNLYKR